jgi:hypothetical protein
LELALLLENGGFMRQVRQAAVAGAFYAGQRQALSNDIAHLLADAAAQTTKISGTVKALIVPHAGYQYSGPMAARAYAQLTNVHRSIQRVVLLGPVHRVPVRGLALPGATAFATPMGEVELDEAAIASLSGLRQVTVSTTVHTFEHSLEVQLPFLQTLLGDFKLVPLAVGDASAEEVAEVLEVLWGGPETLLVISSDLSHYLPYHTAQVQDQKTVQSILDLHGPLTHQQACGGTPINGLLLAAKHHGLRPQLLGVCNSGDTAGDKQRVVGYAAIALTQGDYGTA